jgi:metallopeptidase MepB
MKPSLLTHREVITLFHELGHGIHDLVSKKIYPCFHGTNTVIDFGEAPSQMLEHWCWEPSALKSLSSHYISQERKIPDEMIKSMIGAKRVNSALLTLKQLHLGIFDMIVHEPKSHDTIEKLNISARYNTLHKELMQIDGPETLGLGEEWGHGQARFGHLMGDYDVGYYGYLRYDSQTGYEEHLCTKLFLIALKSTRPMFYTIFKENPMSPEEGRKYRYMVLEKGGSQDEMKTLVDFLGREPKPEAFYQEIGLA